MATRMRKLKMCQQISAKTNQLIKMEIGKKNRRAVNGICICILFLIYKCSDVMEMLSITFHFYLTMNPNSLRLFRAIYSRISQFFSDNTRYAMAGVTEALKLSRHSELLTFVQSAYKHELQTTTPKWNANKSFSSCANIKSFCLRDVFRANTLMQVEFNAKKYITR